MINSKQNNSLSLNVGVSSRIDLGVHEICYTFASFCNSFHFKNLFFNSRYTQG